MDQQRKEGNPDLFDPNLKFSILVYTISRAHAMGKTFNAFAFSADMITMPDAPSLISLEFPTVTVPVSGRNAGGSFSS